MCQTKDTQSKGKESKAGSGHYRSLSNRKGGMAEERAREGYTDFSSTHKTPRLCVSTRMAAVEAEIPEIFKTPVFLARTIQSCARYLLGTLLQKSTSPVQRGERDAHCKLTLCLGGNCYIPDVSF